MTAANIGSHAGWAGGIAMNLYNSVQLLFGLDGFPLGFLLSSTSVFNQQQLRAGGILFPTLNLVLHVAVNANDIPI